MALLETFKKSSVEAYVKTIDYDGRISNGLTVSSVAVSSIDLLTGASASVVTSGSGSGTTANFTVTGGTDGYSYLLTITSTLSSGDIISDQLEMVIEDRPTS